MMQTERNAKCGPNAGVRNIRIAGTCVIYQPLGFKGLMKFHSPRIRIYYLWKLGRSKQTGSLATSRNV